MKEKSVKFLHQNKNKNWLQVPKQVTDIDNKRDFDMKLISYITVYISTN